MNRPPQPTSRLMRAVLAAFALVMTVALGGFIDLLADAQSASAAAASV
jgi:hypothetical protein